MDYIPNPALCTASDLEEGLTLFNLDKAGAGSSGFISEAELPQRSFQKPWMCHLLSCQLLLHTQEHFRQIPTLPQITSINSAQLNTGIIMTWLLPGEGARSSEIMQKSSSQVSFAGFFITFKGSWMFWYLCSYWPYQSTYKQITPVKLG